MSLRWFGNAHIRKVNKASRIGINMTMTEAVWYAKHFHPFYNQTGTAERSIQISRPAKTGLNITSGFWGSVGVDYFAHLEFGTKKMAAFPTLRPAAANRHPNLARNIHKAFKRL